MVYLDMETQPIQADDEQKEAEVIPRKMPGEHHAHKLHYGMDPVAEKKKAVALQYASKTAIPLPETHTRVVIGVSGPETDCLIGTVRYTGKVVFSGGDWVGVELDEPHGKNSGSVLGCTYFLCLPHHGIFVRPKHILAQDENVAPFEEEERIRKQKVQKELEEGGAKIVMNAKRKEKLPPGEELTAYLGSALEPLPEIGTRVIGKLDGKRYPGEVQYAGRVKFAGGDWVGVCLDEPLGKNNGTVNGIEYFQCPKNRGLFVRPDACIVPQKLEESETYEDVEGVDNATLEMMSPEELRDMVAQLQSDMKAQSQLVQSLQEQVQSPRSLQQNQDLASRENAAATTISSGFRAKQARLKVDQMRQDQTRQKWQQKLKEDAAATKIQRHLRGRIAVREPSPFTFQMKKASLFHALDVERRGRLQAAELYNLAVALGFEDGEEAFAEVFASVCSDLKVNVEEGLTVRNFVTLTSSKDGEFEIADSKQLANLTKTLVVDEEEAARQEDEAAQSDRETRLQAICKARDYNQDGFLNASEVFDIVQILGYIGNLEEMKPDFKAMCEDHVDSKVGIHMLQLAGEMNNPGGELFVNESILPDFSDALDVVSREPVEPVVVVMTRAERLEMLFEAYDCFDNGVMQRGELYQYAQKLEYEGSEEDFTEEYDDLCKQYDTDPADGIDLKAFMDLASAKDSTYFIPDVLLKELLTFFGIDAFTPRSPKTPSELSRSPRPSPSPSPRTSGLSPSPSQNSRSSALVGALAPIQESELTRDQLVGALFKALDAQKTGRLRMDELLVYAQKLGFDGPASEFVEEYEGICNEYKCDSKVGLDVKEFASICNDSEGNFYSDDELLPQLLSQMGLATGDPVPEKALSKTVPPKHVRTTSGDPVPEKALSKTVPPKHVRTSFANSASRQQALFKALDKQGTKRLKCSEFFVVAQKVGFPDSEAEFVEEYQQICTDEKCDADIGIDEGSFLRVTGDLNGNYYMEDKQMEELITELEEQDLPVIVNASSRKELELPMVKFRSEVSYEARTSISRKEKVAALFAAMDSLDNGKLALPEMHLLAQVMGFEGPVNEFAEDYDELCKELKIDKKVGLDQDIFDKIVNDSDGDWYVEDVDATMKDLEGKRKVKTAEKAPTREDLVKAVFAALDIDNKDRVTINGMFLVAQNMDYPGSLQDYEEEFGQLCAIAKVDVKTGLDFKAFASQVNDTSEDADYYLDNAALAKFLEELSKKAPAAADSEQPAADSKRSESIKALFLALDINKNSVLENNELFVYAQQLGYPEDENEFQEEYGSICNGARCDPRKGLDLKAFELLTSGNTQDDYYCDDAKLAELLQELQSSPAPLAAVAATVVLAPAPAAIPKVRVRDTQIAEIFRAADLDKSGRLNCEEMFMVAQVLGYPDTLEEFAPEFEELVKRKRVTDDPKPGIDAFTFTEEADDPEGDFSIEDAVLASFVQDLATKQTAKSKALDISNVANTDEPLLDAVFVALDADKDNKLLYTELFPYASLIGFPDGEEEFADEYESLCNEYKCDPEFGLAREHFRAIASSPDSDYYADAARLAEILAELTSKQPMNAVAPAAMATTPASNAALQPSPRAELIDAVFQTLDADRDGRLNMAELYVYAQLKEFPDSLDVFAEEYGTICKDLDFSPELGPDKNDFTKLVNDQEGNYYAEDMELKAFIYQLKVRDETVASIFKEADSDNKGVLTRAGMYGIAQLLEYPESEEAFEEEWGSICERVKADTTKGIDVKQFTKIINDASGDYYIQMADLASFLEELQK